MKKLLFTLTLAGVALLALPASTRAEDPKPDAAKPARGAGRFNPEERLKRMTELLTLTAEQQDKVKAILEKDRAKFDALKDATPEERRGKVVELMKAQMEEIGAVLTQEQKDKMKADAEKRRAERGAAKPADAKPAEAK